jgi:hypothetical protein
MSDSRLLWLLALIALGGACGTSASSSTSGSASGATGVSGSIGAAGASGTTMSAAGSAGIAVSAAGMGGTVTSAAGAGGLGQAGLGGAATGGQGGATSTTVMPYTGLRQSNVIIGNVFLANLGAVAFVSNDEAAVLMQVSSSDIPGTAAPDGSINKFTFSQNGANISFDWTRTGNAIAARLSADKPITFALQLIPSWPSFHTTYAGSADGAIAMAAAAQGKTVTWTLKASQNPATEIFVKDASTLDAAIQAGKAVQASGATAGALLFALTPNTPVQIAAGFDGLLPFTSVNDAIDKADGAYAARRVAASGDWGDFAGPIADNMDNTRLYSSVTHRVAHTVSRTFFMQTDPDYPVFFCWDSFFNGLLASLEDPETGRDTVRGILSFQTPEGLVPNFGGWKTYSPDSTNYSSTDRSQPPVASLAVWKMHQRWPDMAFLAEVYPMLVKWHDWWPTARDGNKNGLLEWGAGGTGLAGANFETGWDDNVEYDGASMVGNNMNVDAVDLNSLWAMDAEYLANIATALGKTSDATRFQADHDKTAQLMNSLLWNAQLGMYCSRPWDPINGQTFLTRLTPMNFYPLIAGVPTATQAAAVLKVLTTTTKFWGDWVLPTVAYDDPAWSGQTYWHGTIWGPVNYLVFQGLKRYATPELQAEFARRSVNLFMTNWKQGIDGENYFSTTGGLGGNPHYTWGTLMGLIAIEAAADINTAGVLVPGKGFTSAFQLSNIPAGGKLYDIQVSGGAATVSAAK